MYLDLIASGYNYFANQLQMNMIIRRTTYHYSHTSAEEKG